jgi:hypothetical protein
VVRSADHTRCRRQQRLGGVNAGADEGTALLQRVALDPRRFDLLLRHRALELLEAPDAPIGNGQLSFQLGQLRPLIATLDGAADRAQIGQHLTFDDSSSRHRHAFGAGHDAAGKGGLDPAARIGVRDHLAVELDRRGEIADTGSTGTNFELALHRLGHEQAAVGQALRSGPTLPGVARGNVGVGLDALS